MRVTETMLPSSVSQNSFRSRNRRVFVQNTKNESGLQFSRRYTWSFELCLFFFFFFLEAAIIPKAAGCAVELKTISLRDTNDPSLYYYPPCTRVYRCGGCCAHDLLACQPTKTETLNYEVRISHIHMNKLLWSMARNLLEIAYFLFIVQKSKHS